MAEAVLNWIAQGLAVAAVTGGGLRLLGRRISAGA